MNSIDKPNTPHVAEAAPEFDGVRMLSDYATPAGSIGGNLGDVLKLTELLGDPHRAMSSDAAGASLWWGRVATVAGLIMLVDLAGRVLGSCGGAR
jgi:hypothetical protein